jgi:Bacterial SH3 domain
MTHELMVGAVPYRQKRINKPKSKPEASPVSTNLRRDGYGSFVAGLVLGVLVTLVGVKMWQARYPDGSGFPSGPLSGTVDDSRDGRYPAPTQSLGSVTYRVRVPRMSVRNCAGMNCQVIAVLPEGTAVSVIEQGPFIDNQPWVRISARGQEGWVSRLYIE